MRGFKVRLLIIGLLFVAAGSLHKANDERRKNRDLERAWGSKKECYELGVNNAVDKFSMLQKTTNCSWEVQCDMVRKSLGVKQ